MVEIRESGMGASVRRRTGCGNERGGNGQAGGAWLLQTVQGRQRRFERTSRQGLRGFVFFVLLKSTQALRLKHALGLVAEQHCVTVESNAHFVGVGI